jgi:hypothetical protein
MEPNKLDNKIREELEVRRIQPSEQTWNRLDAMLSAAEKPKPNYNWMFVAANFVGFLLIATIFFSQPDELIEAKEIDSIIYDSVTSTDSEGLIDDRVKENISTNKLDKKTESAAASESKNAESKKDNNIAVKEKKQIVQNKIFQSPKGIITQEKMAIKSNNNKNEQSITQINNSVITNPINTGVDEQLVLLEQSSGKVFASRKIAIKVNASSLLSEVDGELELSFREKVINKVGKNFQTLKVAVANRNFE